MPEERKVSRWECTCWVQVCPSWTKHSPAFSGFSSSQHTANTFFSVCLYNAHKQMCVLKASTGAVKTISFLCLNRLQKSDQLGERCGLHDAKQWVIPEKFCCSCFCICCCSKTQGPLKHFHTYFSVYQINCENEVTSRKAWSRIMIIFSAAASVCSQENPPKSSSCARLEKISAGRVDGQLLAKLSSLTLKIMTEI